MAQQIAGELSTGLMVAMMLVGVLAGVGGVLLAMISNTRSRRLQAEVVQLRSCLYEAQTQNDRPLVELAAEAEGIDEPLLLEPDLSLPGDHQQIPVLRPLQASVIKVVSSHAQGAVANQDPMTRALNRSREK